MHLREKNNKVTERVTDTVGREPGLSEVSLTIFQQASTCEAFLL